MPEFRMPASSYPVRRAAHDPIPLTIVGGYLGAGKTTLINHLIADIGGPGLAVVVNDFGPAAFDPLLISHRRAQLVSVAPGCICCERQTEFVLALAHLRSGLAPLAHVLVEASGISDPARIAEYADLHGFRVEAVLVVADAEAVRVHAALPGVGARVRDQLAAADLVVLNKVDLVTEVEKQSVLDWLGEVAPDVRVVEASYGRVPASLALDWTGGQTTASHRTPDLSHAPLTGDGRAECDRLYSVWSWSREAAVDAGAFRWWVASLPQTLLRGKGVLHVGGDAEHRYVFHLAGRRWTLSPGTRWGLEAPRTGLVLIGPYGSFDPDYLDMTIAECVLGSFSLRSSAWG